MRETRDPGLAALLLSLAALPWATSAHEIATALALAAALIRWRRDPGAATAALRASPATAPALLLAALWCAAGILPPDRDGPGHAWLLAPLIAAPILLHRADPAAVDQLRRVGLGSAAAAALYGAGRAALSGAQAGATSHHLTLAWMLLPPLSVAIRRRTPGRAGIALIAALSLGLIASGGRGAALAAVVALPAALLPARLGSVIAATLAGLLTVALLPLAPPEDQAQRALLWAGALDAEGAGAARALPEMIAAWDRRMPGFWFPWHAHDALLQHRAVLGAAGWGAALWLLLAMLRGRGGYAITAAAAGIWTQDTLGDLEVARAMYLWWALEQAGGEDEGEKNNGGEGDAGADPGGAPGLYSPHDPAPTPARPG